MLLKRLIVLICFCFCSFTFAATNALDIPTNLPANLSSISPKNINQKNSQSIGKISRVIYITLDGVRWQNIFEDPDHFKIFWQKYGKNLKIYGAPGSPLKIEVASVPTSLPSYQSQMSGAVQPCKDNFCGRIHVETLPENLMHHFGFQKKDVAIFASWYEIEFATEHQFGATFTNAGNQPVYDPDTGVADPVMLFLNEQQNKYSSDLLDRFDVFTFAQAMHYLEVYQPRFLWISLTDADTAAHLRSMELYNSVLDLYDRMLDIFFYTLDTLKLSDDTLVIITTDHGRGNGDHWPDHGPKYPESKQTWAFVKNGELVAINPPNYFSTLSIRPTVERVFSSASSKA